MATAARFLDEGGTNNDPTLQASMNAFVIPVILSLVFFVVWILIFLKTCNGTLSSGREAKPGGPCCRRLLMGLCFFQSFFGFLLVFSRDQKHAPALIYYPMAGFVAFAGNNPACPSTTTHGFSMSGDVRWPGFSLFIRNAPPPPPLSDTRMCRVPRLRGREPVPVELQRPRALAKRVELGALRARRRVRRGLRHDVRRVRPLPVKKSAENTPAH